MLGRRAYLPALRRDRALERALQTRLILARELSLAMHLARVIAAAGRRAANAIRHGEAPQAATATLAGELGRVIAPALAETARTFGARVVASPKSAHAFPLERKAFDDLDQAIRGYTGASTARRVVAVSDSLRETIRRTVEQGVAEQLGQEEIARRIVDATSGEIGMDRARRIARTEVHAAAMYGQQAAAEASPLQFEKVWLATEDARTRQSHADANGQRVGLDESFELRPEGKPVVRLRYPGDENGPPGEIINCRCVCTWEPLPIEKEPGKPRQPEQPEFERITVPDRPIDIDLPAALDPGPVAPGAAPAVIDDEPPAIDAPDDDEPEATRLSASAVSEIEGVLDLARRLGEDHANSLAQRLAVRLEALTGIDPGAGISDDLIATLRTAHWTSSELIDWLEQLLEEGP